jgi:hypothetical protein
MRIAFDLDNTLIPQAEEFATEPSAPLLLRPWFRERLRVGTRALLQELRWQGCDLWIYTSSGRDATYLRLWFLSLGIPLGGVVNCHRHEGLLRGRNIPNCAKYPPAFGIELLIDDANGIAMEGREHGFAVLRIDPADTDWVARIRAAIVPPTMSQEGR